MLWIFDHTLVDHDKLLPGAKWGMQQLRDQNHKILIFSCNNKEWIKKILDYHEIPYDYIYDGAGKPNCDAYIDDRGIGFNGNWEDALTDLSLLAKRREFIKKLV